jgi:hypothetical protein
MEMDQLVARQSGMLESSLLWSSAQEGTEGLAVR